MPVAHLEMAAGVHDILIGGVPSTITVPAPDPGTIDQASPTVGDTLTVSNSNEANVDPSLVTYLHEVDTGGGYGPAGGTNDAASYTTTGQPTGTYRRGMQIGDLPMVYTPGVAVAAAPAFDPATLFVGGRKGWWYDFGDLSNVFQDTGRTTAVTAAGQSLLGVNDKSGLGRHMSYTGAGNGSTATYRETSGQGRVEFAIGTNIAGFLSVANSEGADITNLTVFVGLKTSDTTFVLQTTDASNAYTGAAIDGDTAGVTGSSMGSPTFHVGGGSAIASPNRDVLHTNWSTGGWVVAEIQGFTLPLAREHALGYYGGALDSCLVGDVTSVICVNNVTSQERSDIVAYIQGKEV